MKYPIKQIKRTSLRELANLFSSVRSFCIIYNRRRLSQFTNFRLQIINSASQIFKVIHATHRKQTFSRISIKRVISGSYITLNFLFYRIFNFIDSYYRTLKLNDGNVITSRIIFNYLNSPECNQRQSQNGNQNECFFHRFSFITNKLSINPYEKFVNNAIISI